MHLAMHVSTIQFHQIVLSVVLVDTAKRSRASSFHIRFASHLEIVGIEHKFVIYAKVTCDELGDVLTTDVLGSSLCRSTRFLLCVPTCMSRARSS